MESCPYFIYIILCKNNNLYCGYTTNIERRWQEHVSGSPKCKYTRSHKPMKIVAAWEIQSTLSIVLKLEHRIKKLTRIKKIKLIAHPTKLADLLTDSETDTISLEPLTHLPMV